VEANVSYLLSSPVPMLANAVGTRGTYLNTNSGQLEVTISSGNHIGL